EAKMKQRSFKVSVAALAAFGCVSSTAFALENQFNGMLRIKGDITNFDQAGGNDAGAYNLPSTNGTGKDVLSKNNLGRSFFYTEQRARLKYTGKFNNDVKLVTQFEIDSRWGDSSQFVARNQGGAMEADSINLETKSVYMEFKVPYLPTIARAGIQPVDDMYKGIFVGTDAAAFSTVTKLDKATLYLTWLRGYDNKNFNGAAGAVTAIGTDTAGGTNGWPGRYSLDSFLFDVKYDVSKALNVGVSDYVVYENLTGSHGYNLLNTVGLNASYNFGSGLVDGFVLFQHGDNPANNFGQVGQKVSSFAANIGGKIKLGPGTVRANLLYASGDDGKGKVGAFQGLNQLGDKNTTSTFPAAQMTMLITNTKYAANTDRGLINTITNYNQGVMGAFLGYDVDIDKAFIKANLGLAAAAHENQTFKPRNLKSGGFNSNYIGTEINTEFGYRISENLTASLVSGYVLLGDYYKDTAYKNNTATAASIITPDNPWKNMVVFNLTF
ncbi:MAG: hypothetical protein PHD54_15785, partial [Desulfuromonadaceae bacterium]|nr:hypothetical protein [Desulfuromonadaceae bacterium]